MRRILVGTVITGDGKTVYEPGYVVVEGGRIAEVGPGKPATNGAERQDFGRSIIAPGLINLHAHGLTPGPAHATGSKSLTADEVNAFKDRHIRGGTTTAMSVDGFPLWSEYMELNDSRPLRVLKCTAHSPANFRAADEADGAGLTAAHRAATMDQLVAQGAHVIGEIGAGGTLGGGMQDYAYIPKAIHAACGRTVDQFQARALKEAILGRTIDPANLDRNELHSAMERAGLAGVMTEEQVVKTITDCVMPSMAHAYEGMREARQASDRTGKPFMVHHAAASAEVVVEVANERLIAAHCNHPSFLPEESVHYAKELRRRGAALEISGLDLFSRQKGREDAEPFLALVREGLVDFVGTDYAGGKHDPVCVPLFHIAKAGLVSVPQAIAFSTGNVTRRFPELTDAGLLEAGRPADIAVFTPDFDGVISVFREGRTIFAAG